jgi:hypothetical protein
MVGDLYLYYMGLFEKFLEGNSYLRELLDTYLELRLHFQEEGFSQEELKSITQPTYKMIRLGEKFIEKKKALFRQIQDYGFEIQQSDLLEYITPLLKKIDEITPLKENGNNERNDIGNEDY